MAAPFARRRRLRSWLGRAAPPRVAARHDIRVLKQQLQMSSQNRGVGGARLHVHREHLGHGTRAAGD